MTSFQSKRPEELGGLLKKICNDKNWQQRLQLFAVFDFWNEIVGPEIARFAQPSLIRGRVLWVKVADSVWMQQLQFQKMLLLDQINDRVTGQKFTDIHLQFDSEIEPSQPPPVTSIKQKKPSKKKEQEFDRLLGSLADDDARKALKHLWVKLYGNR